MDFFLTINAQFFASCIYSIKVGFFGFWGGFLLAVFWVYYAPRHSHYLALFVIAMPAGAVGLGYIFLTAPSGFLVRGFLVRLFGLDQPLDFYGMPDYGGYAHIMVIIIKESAFLSLILTTARAPLSHYDETAIAGGVGAGPAFARVIIPLILQKCRPALVISMVYALNALDVYAVAGGNIAGNLSHYLAQNIRGYAGINPQQLWVIGAVFMVINVAFIGCNLFLLGLLARFAQFLAPLLRVSPLMVWGLIVLMVAIIVLNILWALADGWFFPNILPNNFTLQNLVAVVDGDIGLSFTHSLLVALLANGLVLAILILIIHYRHLRNINQFFLAPIIIPEILLAVILYPLTSILPNMVLIIIAQSLILLPYYILTARGFFTHFPQNLLETAQSHGLRAWPITIKILLPIIQPILWVSAGVGMVISLNIYGIMLLLGDGRTPYFMTNIIPYIYSPARPLATSAMVLLTLLGFVMLLLSQKSTKIFNDNR